MIISKSTFIACLLAALLLSPAKAQVNLEQKDKVPAADAGNVSTPPAHVTTIIGPIGVEREKADETDWNQLRCSDAKSHNEADLCEQRRMAQAAADAVWWARTQAILGLAGFLGIIVSLAFTGWAAIAASRAARAAQDAVRVASDTAERELRAYISFTNVRIENLVQGQDFRIYLTLKNVGQTPAKEWKAWAQVFFRPDPDKGVIRFNINKRQSIADFGTGGEYIIPLPPQQIPASLAFPMIVHDMQYIVVAGFYSYRDIFKKRRRGTFRYFVRYSILVNGTGSLVSCSSHNASN